VKIRDSKFGLALVVESSQQVGLMLFYLLCVGG